MVKHLILLFLLITQIFSFDQTRIKAKQIGNVIQAKTIIKTPMINIYQAKLRTGDENNADFIKHVSAQVDGDIVYEISLSPYLTPNPLLKFNYTYQGRGDTLKLIVTDNKGRQTNFSAKIKDSLGKNDLLRSKRGSKTIDFWKTKPKLWELTNTEEAIEELYGSNKAKENGIKVVIPYRGTKAYYVPIDISSKLALESIAIFSDDLTNRTYRGKIPSIRAIISISENTTVNYSLYILTSGRCCVDKYVPLTVAGRDKNGQVYKTVLDAELLCSADCEM